MFHKIKNALLICLILLIVSIPNTGYTQVDIYGNLGPRKTSTTASTPILDAIKNLPSQQKAQQNIDKQKDVVNGLAGNSYLGTTSPAKTAVDVQQKLLQKSQEETAANITQQITQKSNEDYSTDLKTNMDTALSDLEKTKTSIKDTEAELKTLKAIQEKFNDDAFMQAEIEKKQEELEKLQEKELEQSYIAAGLQASYQNAQQSLAAFNNAQNIGSLELMQAANGRVTYQGCTFLRNFDPNSALGKGDNRVLQSAICWMQDVSASLGVGMALGSTFIKMGTDDFWDAFMTIIIGICIFLSFFIIYLMFPLKLLNAFVRLGFIFALMPLWIVLWVFPVTAGYTKKAWDSFIGTLFFFISLSIIISLILILMNQSIQPDSARTKIFELMLDDKTSNAANLMEFGRTFFTTLAFGLMSFSLLGTAETLSNMFASAPSLGLDKAMIHNAAPVYNITKSVTSAAVGGATALAGLGIGAIRKGREGSQKPAPTRQYNPPPGGEKPKPDQTGGGGTGGTGTGGTGTAGTGTGGTGTGGTGTGGTGTGGTGTGGTGTGGTGTGGTGTAGTGTGGTGTGGTGTGGTGTGGTGTGGTGTGGTGTGGTGTGGVPNPENSSSNRYLTGIKTVEELRKNTAGFDKQLRNDYCQKYMNQFFEEEAKKGIFFSTKEQKALSEVLKGSTTPEKAKKVFDASSSS